MSAHDTELLHRYVMQVYYRGGMVPHMTTEGTPADPVRVHIERMRDEGIDVTAPSIVSLVRHLHDVIATVNLNTEVMRVIANRADSHQYLAGD